MLIEHSDDFHKWLIKEISPICDADPVALAKYVLALLKKPQPAEELRQFCTEQLDVFLGSHTARFVEKTFNVLKTKSYVIKTEAPDSTSEKTPSVSVSEKSDEKDKRPQTSSAPADPPVKESEHKAVVVVKEEVPSKTDDRRRRGGSSTATRGRDDTNPERKPESSSSAPVQKAVRKRISPPPSDNREKPLAREAREHVRRRSRSPVVRASSRDRDRRTNRGGRRAASNERSERYQRRRSRSRSQDRERRERTGDSRKKRCKNFEEQGFCTRGDQCPYDHGPDPVVVDETALGKIVKLDVAKPPNFSVPPPGYNPMNPPPPGVAVENLYAPTSNNVEGYNPEAPSIAPNYSVPPPPIPISAPFRQQQYIPQTGNQTAQPANTFSGYTESRGGRGGRGRGRGGRIYQNQGSRPVSDNATLQVKKIPAEMNNITKLNEHFANFGTIENIQVRYNGEADSALITYASRNEAMSAYKSPTPVLNNRFIKVFWHSTETAEATENSAPTTLQSGIKVEKPAPIVVEKTKITTRGEAKFVSADLQARRAAFASARERYVRENEQFNVLIDLQRRKNDVLDKLLKQQKALVNKARKEPDEEAKARAKELVTRIFERIKQCKVETDQFVVTVAEKTKRLEEAKAAYDELKGSRTTPEPEEQVGESRKRKASDDEINNGKSKLTGVVVIKDVKADDINDLLTHMESFGETFDSSVIADGDIATAIVPYLRLDDARKAISHGSLFKGAELSMELQTRLEDESTDTNMTADQLLAAIPAGAESDDDNE